MAASWQHILESLPPITLEEMKSVKLMNRIDSKFLSSIDLLPLLLADAKNEGYSVQIIEDNVRLASYDTWYYDTPELIMYLRHHDKQLRRQKIRVRQYVDSDLMFLEIKNKTNTGRTKKKRRSLPSLEFPQQLLSSLEQETAEFLLERSWYDPETLIPQVRTQFKRITLVNPEKTERLTIDTDLHWTNLQAGETFCFDKLMVIELKQDGHIQSKMREILLNLRIKSIKMSKYCMGVALTHNEVKHNRFLPKIRTIEKLLE